MASSQACLAVNLNENQVPGAALQPLKAIEAHSNVQLKRWLQCRGLPVGGKKANLVERVKACIESGNTGIVPHIDNGHWYNISASYNKVLLNKNTTNTNTVPVFPVTGWKVFPSNNIPKHFSYGIIYHHLIESAVMINNDIDKESSGEENNSPEFNTSKPLRKGRQYFRSGHVKELQDCLTKNESNYCLKSKVMSSFHEDVSFTVMVMLDKLSAKVVDSSCGCAASAMGRCSHVAGLLFALEDYVVSFGYAPTSCTSKLCLWNMGRTAKKDPSTIMDKKYSNKVEPKLKNLHVPKKVDENQSELNNKLLYEFQFHNVPTMWELLLDFNYIDYELSNDRRCELLVYVNDLKQNLTFGCTEPTELLDTKLQGESERWRNIRAFLVTASECKKIYNAKPESFFSKIENKLWNPIHINNKYILHGNENEKFARLEYTRKTGYQVETSGLWIHPKYVGLGASPDGLVYDSNTQSHGILEIKCPFVLKDHMPNDLSKLTTAQRNRFCATLDLDGKLHLKEDHDYYFQVQMQVAILERHWCDFVIWTFMGIHIERIYFNKSFWECVFPKLCEFHTNVLCPEYFEMRVPRKLEPFNLQPS